MNELLRQALSELESDEVNKLVYALNNEITLWIKLADARFIGVNVRKQSNMIIKATHNSWSYGVFNE